MRRASRGTMAQPCAARKAPAREKQIVGGEGGRQGATARRCRRTAKPARFRRMAWIRPSRGLRRVSGTRSCSTRSRRNDVKLVTYVPDRVLTPLISPSTPTRSSRLCHGARGGGGRHRLRRLDGRHARRRPDADERLRHARQCAGLAGGALPDPADHAGVGARHAGGVQLGAGAGVPHHAPGARLRWPSSTTP